MTAAPTPRDVIESAAETVLSNSGVDFWRECEVVDDIGAAVLAALAAAPEETRVALARTLLQGTQHAVVPREPTDRMQEVMVREIAAHDPRCPFNPQAARTLPMDLEYMRESEFGKEATAVYRAMLAAAQEADDAR